LAVAAAKEIQSNRFLLLQRTSHGFAEKVEQFCIKPAFQGSRCFTELITFRQDTFPFDMRAIDFIANNTVGDVNIQCRKVVVPKGLVYIGK
jgi:hypothetical protein